MVSLSDSEEKVKMEGKNPNKKELLERYVLGLTSREQSEEVQSMLQNDPDAQRDLAYLREQLTAYADAYTAVKSPANRTPRTQEDFDDLDHEMIMDMTERNHSLVIWRYALGIACLLLLGLSGFLFRQNQTANAALLTERATHAQDDISHQLKIKSLEADAVDWAALQTERQPTELGDVLVHYSGQKHTALLDFSHIAAPDEDWAYYLFLDETSEAKAALKLTAVELHRLYPVALPITKLRIYYWPTSGQPAPPLPAADLRAELRFASREK